MKDGKMPAISSAVEKSPTCSTSATRPNEMIATFSYPICVSEYEKKTHERFARRTNA